MHLRLVNKEDDSDYVRYEDVYMNPRLIAAVRPLNNGTAIVSDLDGDTHVVDEMSCQRVIQYLNKLDKAI